MTDSELRSIALEITALLPEEMDDARRACDLALILKRWEDEAEPVDKAKRRHGTI